MFSTKTIQMANILVVGGSKGIGAALIETLLPENTVINLSRTAPSITHPNLTHNDFDVLQDDIPLFEDVQAIVYCPGSINLKPITSLKTEDFKADFEINVLGAVKIIQKYARKLKKQDNASVVLFSTVAVQQGMPFHASVAAAKGAIEGITKSLAAEFAPNIRVNCVAPSLTKSKIAEPMLKNTTIAEGIAKAHPLKRLGEGKDSASLAKFLITEDSSWVTGQIIAVDGGRSKLS